MHQHVSNLQKAVSVTLLPITAILLLLSGMSAPAHGMKQARIVALGGHWLGSAATQGNAPTSVRFARTDREACMPRLHRGWSGVSRQPFLPFSLRAATRKLYRTRFGFAEGAYLALGPPSAGYHPDLG